LPRSIHAAIIATMCGPYSSFLPAEAVARMFGAVNPLPNLAPSWNVAPTQNALVVRRHPETAERHLDLLKWGLLPHWTKEPTKAQRPINARCETAAKSGMFRGTSAQRRCIVHADAFYEWKVVEGASSRTRSHGRTERTAHRMPVILEEHDWSVWLTEAEGDYRALLRSAPDGTLRTWPVDPRVGSTRNNGPELLEAAA
jgi:putative SOS response-associated peptidase YedK